MKRIISIMLVAVMFACALAVNVSSAGTLYFSSDFTNDSTFAQHFYPEGFSAVDGMAVGYSEAFALQTVGSWASYDVTFDIAFEEDELAPEGASRYLSFVYFSENVIHKGLSDERSTISVCFDITKDEVSLVANDFVLNDTCIVLAGPAPFKIEDSKDYNFGVSITEGRIRVFSESTVLIDYVDTKNEYYIGYSFEEVEPSVLVWWNTNNCAMFKDIKVASPEYFYPAMAAPSTSDGDNSATAAPTQAPEATTSKKVVDVTDDKGNAVTDDKGNKVTEEIVITDPPVADTNPNNGVGGVGTATPTGDKAVIVVAAMVITIGCALVVKKINVD